MGTHDDLLMNKGTIESRVGELNCVPIILTCFVVGAPVCYTVHGTGSVFGS